MTMEGMTEEQRIEAARIRDEAAAAAQGDRTAWSHLLDVIHAPDAHIRELEAENRQLYESLIQGMACPHCGKHVYLHLQPRK